MDPMLELRQTFFQECEELLVELESGLMAMDDGSAVEDTVHAVFRAVHSIKGGAGAFALDDLVKFAHIFETTLDEVRTERMEATPDVMSVMLRSTDVLSDLVRAAREGESVDQERSQVLIDELAALSGVSTEPQEPSEDEVNFAPVLLDFDLGDDDDDDNAEADSTDAVNAETDNAEDAEAKKSFIINFRPKPELYANANEASLLLRDLARFGDVDATCDVSQVPDLDGLDPEGAYLAWTINVTTTEDKEALSDVFDFVDGDCDLEIVSGSEDAVIAADDGENAEPNAEANTEAEAETAAGASEENDTEDNAEEDVIPAAEAEEPAIALVEEESEAPSQKSEPTEAVEAAAPAPAAGQKSAEAATGGAKTAGAAPATVRVDLGRVDRLINLVGELVINQAMLAQCAIDAGMARESGVESGLEELKHLTRDIQESVMAIRAQPVRTLFQRMSRIVREAASATGKSVRLVTDGEMTEVDKTVVERLADPLTHMIRNAVDHGLESTEKREATGKSAQGEVHLSAAHRSGRVVIEVTDDGAGINRDRVKQIAIDKQLISEDAVLSDSEIDNLIFLPGFSTVEQVSNLSGRGVGMDVVKRAIQALGGKITISSKPGKGSVFSISLPLTLAILDGMVVEIAGQTLVVPLTAIIETLKPDASDIHTIGSDAQVISIRGDFIPLVDIGSTMKYRKVTADPTKGVVLSVETDAGERCALMVDAIHDQRQVVIKSLEENYGTVPGVAAATILGDGRIALILDVDGIIANTSEAPSYQETPLAAVG